MMSFTDILPSRQFIWTVLSLATAATLISLATDAGREAAREAGVKTASQKTITQETDTDEDGLKDWEEALWGTNPREADTDGDGTKDGAEVDANRDPTKPGPDDELREAPDSIAAADGDETSTLTRTDVFSRKLFSSFVAAQQTGGLDEKAQREFASEFVRTNFANTPTEKKYNKSDFTPRSNSRERLRTYGNTAGTILQTYGSQVKENELIVVQTALVSNNPDKLKDLTPIISLYEQAERDLANVSPPSSLLDEHVDSVNAVSSIATQLKKMETAFNDPVAAMSAIATYRNQAQILQESIQGLKIEFSEQGIAFPSNEPGSIFFK